VSAAGRFIAFEGGEGVGKSTQARLLAEALRQRGIACVVTREPGGTPGAEAIRTLLLDPALPKWTTEAEALLFAAARADHVANLIRPALAEGRWVICDRFVDSSRAYQGAAGRLGDEAVRALHAIGSGRLLPDLTVLLELDGEVVADRLASRDGGEHDKIGARGTDYHDAVAAAFRRFADEEPKRFVRIAGGGSAEQVHAEVMRALAGLLPGAAA
jgi:dTMP kinase